MVALNSSGATRDCNPGGKLVLKLLLNPKLEREINRKDVFVFSDSSLRKTNCQLSPIESFVYLNITYTVIFPVPRIIIGSSVGAIIDGDDGSSSY